MVCGPFAVRQNRHQRAFRRVNQTGLYFLTLSLPTLVLLTVLRATHIVPTQLSPHSPPHCTVNLTSSTMSAEEDQQSQSGYDEQAGGPGAPTPLAALEVSLRLETST